VGAAVEQLLDDLVDGLRRNLGHGLVGVSVYGSVATGDFDDAVSDVDLLVVLDEDISGDRFVRLDAFHDGVVAAQPEWNDRLDIAYVSAEGLRTFRVKASPLASISPGEPFNVKPAGVDWLLNWYQVREHGRTLVGPSPRTMIGEISTDELVEAARTSMARWRGRVRRPAHLGVHAYAVLTACRALHVHEHGAIVSKEQAASWAQGRLPRQAALIGDALRWRRAAPHGRPADERVEDPVAHRRTIRFVDAVVDRMEAGASAPGAEGD
jgi:hypothetical protein